MGDCRDKVFHLGHYSLLFTLFFLPISTSLTNIFFFSAIGLLLCSKEAVPYLKQCVHFKTNWIFLSVFALSLLGLTYGDVSLPHRDGITHYLTYGLAIFLFAYMQKDHWRERYLWAFFAAMLLTLILSYLKYFGLINIKPGYSAATIFKDHIFTSIAFALTFYFFGLKFIHIPKVRRYLLPLLILLSYEILFISQSITGFSMYFLLLALLGIQHYKFKGLLFATLAIPIMLMVAYAFSSNFSSVINKTIDDSVQWKDISKETSAGHRLNYWNKALILIKQKPLFGYGTGSVKKIYTPVIDGLAIQTSNPHNAYLNTLLQFGLLGLSVLIVMFIYIFKQSLILPQFERFYLQGFLLSFYSGALFNSWFMDFSQSHLFVLFVTLLLAPRYKTKFILSTTQATEELNWQRVGAK